MRFVDTNVAFYAVSTDPEDERKRRIAETLLDGEADSLALSIQVLGEFYVQLTRRSRVHSMSHEEAVAAMESLRSFHVHPLTLETLNKAMQYREQFSLS